jgi:Holliday junction resolvasome RuvABC endonuclease subunit
VKRKNVLLERGTVKTKVELKPTIYVGVLLIKKEFVHMLEHGIVRIQNAVACQNRYGQCQQSVNAVMDYQENEGFI